MKGIQPRMTRWRNVPRHQEQQHCHSPSCPLSRSCETPVTSIRTRNFQLQCWHWMGDSGEHFVMAFVVCNNLTGLFADSSNTHPPQIKKRHYGSWLVDLTGNKTSVTGECHKKEVKEKFQWSDENIHGCIPWYSCDRGLRMEREEQKVILVSQHHLSGYPQSLQFSASTFLNVKICSCAHCFLQWGWRKGTRYKPIFLEYKLLQKALKETGSGDSRGHATCFQQHGGFSSFCLPSPLFPSPPKK